MGSVQKLWHTHGQQFANFVIYHLENMLQLSVCHYDMLEQVEKNSNTAMKYSYKIKTPPFKFYK